MMGNIRYSRVRAAAVTQEDRVKEKHNRQKNKCNNKSERESFIFTTCRGFQLTNVPHTSTLYLKLSIHNTSARFLFDLEPHDKFKDCI